MENSLVKKTNAFKKRKIVYLDPGFWYLSGGGLISVGEMIKEVEKGFDLIMLNNTPSFVKS
ncbi:hypothetical protein CUU64_20955 [Bacillus sp. V5-8f]|nr:hypothetical protein CUU64_20955 [Bacillus sp. V5-8f]